MSADCSYLKLVHSRPRARVSDATLDDTRAFVERYRRAWLSPAIPLAVWFAAPERMVTVGDQNDGSA